MNEAREFWSQTAPKGYAQPAPWTGQVAKAIAAWSPESVLELGCCTGRNLNAIRDLLPEAVLFGYDIAARAIEWGREKHGLDLRHGGDECLKELPDDSVDVAFTVSVLDHIPEPGPVLNELLRISKRHLLLLEPEVEGVNGLLEELNGVQVTPFSYAWNYLDLLYAAAEATDKTICIRREPHPLRGTRAGAAYVRYEVDVL